MPGDFRKFFSHLFLHQEVEMHILDGSDTALCTTYTQAYE